MGVDVGSAPRLNKPGCRKRGPFRVPFSHAVTNRERKRPAHPPLQGAARRGSRNSTHPGGMPGRWRATNVVVCTAHPGMAAGVRTWLAPGRRSRGAQSPLTHTHAPLPPSGPRNRERKRPAHPPLQGGARRGPSSPQNEIPITAAATHTRRRSMAFNSASTTSLSRVTARALIGALTMCAQPAAGHRCVHLTRGSRARGASWRNHGGRDRTCRLPRCWARLPSR